MSGPFEPPPGSGPGAGFQQPPWQPPQQGWSAGPPPRRGNGWKWLLGAVALLAVVGVSVAVTVSVVGGNGDDPQDGPSPAGNGSASDIASANDTGPVEVITEDPSCAPATPVLTTASAAQRNGWLERDPSIPASQWTPEVRAQYEAVGESMRDAADQLVPIARLTPNRVVRQLYEQFIAYSRAYAASIPTYTAADDPLARAATGAGNAVSFICSAINHGSAAARGPLVRPIEAPSQIRPLGDPAEPQRFLTELDPVCEDWSAAFSEFEKNTVAWFSTDPNIPASEWTPELKRIHQEVAPVMSNFADRIQALGDRSGDPVLRDFGELSAQYRRAYVEALPTYTVADKYLVDASTMLTGMVRAACRAVEQ